MQDELEKSNPYNIENYVSFSKDENDIIEIAFANKLPVDKLKQLINGYLNNNGIDSVLNHYPKR